MELHKSKDLYTTEIILKITLENIHITQKKTVMDETLKTEDI